MKKQLLNTAIALALMGVSATSFAQTFIVDNYADDDSKGTLRWALTQANADKSLDSTKGERHKIIIQTVGKAPYVIKVNKPLPEINTPMSIVGNGWASNGDYIAIDGSNYIKGTGVEACPGAVEGQFGTNVRTTTLPGLVLRDTQNVRIEGLEVRHFCIGILVNRASNSVITHNRIMNNYGGAGIMLTGDDGKGNPTATTTNNNKVIDNYLQDNGDGLELTRGAAFNLVSGNQFISTKTNPEPSQGIEILWGNDNAVVGNRFKNYSDGLQINWGQRNYIGYNELSDNSIGFNLTGDGNIIDSNKIYNNRIGIAVRSEKNADASLTFTKNQIWNNSQPTKRCEAGGSCVEKQETGAIVMNVPGLEHTDFVGSRGYGVVVDKTTGQRTCKAGETENCNAMPNQSIQKPTLTKKSANTVQVKYTGQPNALYRVELFGNEKGAEAQYFLGTVNLTTNDSGTGVANWQGNVANNIRTVTATITDANGATSALSLPVTLK